MTERGIHALAVCAGIGGLDLGVGYALGERHRTVCYIERDPFAASVLVARMEEQALDLAPIWDDLTTFDSEPWRGKVDLVTAGIPCQPFSVAGKQRGTADPRWLWPQLWTIIQQTEATSLFLENTPNIGNKALPLILADLAENGWNAEWGLLRAADVGAPHLRNRFFLLAVADTNEPRPQRPQPTRRRDVPTRSSEELAHPDSPRLNQQRLSRIPTNQNPQPRNNPHRRGNTPTGYPPHRNSPDWKHWTGPQPGIRGNTHGTRHRMDQLRTLGNTVAPHQAALAYTLLQQRHNQQQ